MRSYGSIFSVIIYHSDKLLLFLYHKSRNLMESVQNETDDIPSTLRIEAESTLPYLLTHLRESFHLSGTYFSLTFSILLSVIFYCMFPISSVMKNDVLEMNSSLKFLL